MSHDLQDVGLHPSAVLCCCSYICVFILIRKIHSLLFYLALGC